MTKLDTDSTVGRWVVEHPCTARVFEALKIDYCCGGGSSLALACSQRHLDAEQVLAELNRAVADAASGPEEDWTRLSASALCDHIEQTHHVYLRRELPRLTNLIEQVVAAHGERHPELSEVRFVFANLRGELEPHMMKEEQILFPAIRKLEAAPQPPHFPFGTVANPIHMMEHEHAVAGDALTRLRALTHDYHPPEDACNTYRVLLDSLQQLEADLHLHIHKENNILFPQAQALEA